MTAAADDPLRILFHRRQIFVGDLFAGLHYRDAHENDRAEFNRLQAVLELMPDCVARAVDLVCLGKMMPRNPRVIDSLTDGLDLLARRIAWCGAGR